MWPNHMDGSDWWWMSLAMVAFWGLIIWWVVSLRSTNRTGEDVAPNPERLLAERFARGDIDDDEYRRARDTLEGRPESRTGQR